MKCQAGPLLFISLLQLSVSIGGMPFIRGSGSRGILVSPSLAADHCAPPPPSKTSPRKETPAWQRLYTRGKLPDRERDEALKDGMVFGGLDVERVLVVGQLSEVDWGYLVSFKRVIKLTQQPIVNFIDFLPVTFEAQSIR